MPLLLLRLSASAAIATSRVSIVTMQQPRDVVNSIRLLKRLNTMPYWSKGSLLVLIHSLHIMYHTVLHIRRQAPQKGLVFLPPEHHMEVDDSQFSTGPEDAQSSVPEGLHIYEQRLFPDAGHIIGQKRLSFSTLNVSGHMPTFRNTPLPVVQNEVW
jgi:hypothetical protein